MTDVIEVYTQDADVIEVQVPSLPGARGRELELQTTATHIQMRYAGEAQWTNLIALSELAGASGADGSDGADGREVEIQTTGTHIQWRYVGDIAWTDLLALSALEGAAGNDGADGADGDDGWTPIFAAVSDGARRVLQVSDWTGGEGTKPAAGQYVGPLGLVSVIGDAIDIRGAAGADGSDGASGSDGADGAAGSDGSDGDDGWAPILATVSDGARRVLQVSDWTGGTGTKPGTGDYLGPTGFVATAADAVDIRGATGAQGDTGATGDAGATGDTGPAGADGADGSNGADGDDGWAPVLALVSDSERRVLQVSDWVGGTGTKPATGDYVGASGLTSTIGDAIDVRGSTGATGDTGATGATGAAGADGDDGVDGADGDQIKGHRTYSGTTDTPTAADAGKVIRSTGASDSIVTINNGVFAENDVVTLRQAGAGVPTLAEGTNVTLNGDLSVGGQDKALQWVCVSTGATDVFDVYGGVA